MGSRSLFSPFASSVSPQAGRGLRRLFEGPDNIDISPEFLALIQAGGEISPETLAATPMFKGGKSAKEAKARVLSNFSSAQYGDTLSRKSKKELMPLETDENIRQFETQNKFARKQKKEIEEEELGELGTALGPQLGNLSTDQLSNIIPQGTVFGNPAEQARSYIAKVGEKTPVSKAIVETDPRVTEGRIGGEYLNKFTKLGADYLYDPQSRIGTQGGGYQPESNQEMVETGKLVPELGQDGLPTGKMQKERVPRTVTEQIYRPGFQEEIPQRKVATQGELDKFAKPSGANTATKQPAEIRPIPQVMGEPQSYNEAVATDSAGMVARPPTGEQPSNEETRYTGAIPSILGSIDSLNKGVMSFPKMGNIYLYFQNLRF